MGLVGERGLNSRYNRLPSCIQKCIFSSVFIKRSSRMARRTA
jgi:hypothetical protein